MKKTLVVAASGLLLAGLFAGAIEAGNSSVEEDIAAFQGYFKKQFPEVPLDAYSDGVNALPQYEHRRANWEILMEFPPYETEMDVARVEWAEPFANGKTFADCFKDKPPANKYPYYDAASDDIRTIEAEINACLEANGETPIENLKEGKIARLVAAFKEQFNGDAMAVTVDSEGAEKWYRKGQEFYWTKRGQLNFACSDCHVHNAGKNVRGDVLSAGLGHTTGFPVYRTKWAVAGKPWGTVHRRYAGCNEQVRAKAFKPQSDEYKALEYYEAVMSTGVPLKVPSQRQ